MKIDKENIKVLVIIVIITILVALIIKSNHGGVGVISPIVNDIAVEVADELN